MSAWPELLTKQRDDYAEQGEDWRDFAREHVFPYLDQRLPAMIETHGKLPAVCEEIFSRSQKAIGLDCDVVVVFYIGIGCGAGWVTTYAGQPAVLFGLENIAEEGWSGLESLHGLVAHELGHVAHFYWRDLRMLPKGTDAWWQLYIEGFAMVCEQLTLAQESWHMQGRRNAGWLKWCQANRGWLAAEFMLRADKGESMRPFFGSWYDLQGYKQTGYYLGHEFISSLATKKSLQEIACLDDFTTPLRRLLQEFAAH
ncbi:MAG: hypothetical protein R3293_13610 [Candidatus Promineifilaceae bacterium]|nr:hypothetical protein [Candidatus Promineifilaceae bacterium]